MGTTKALKDPFSVENVDVCFLVCVVVIFVQAKKLSSRRDVFGNIASSQQLITIGKRLSDGHY
jgi:hypothetical protein